MRLIAFLAGALALVLAPCAALGQAPIGKSIIAPSGYVPAEAIYCDDGTGKAAPCNFGSGGGGGGGTSTVTSRINYLATASGTGYAIGDQLERVVTSTPSTGVIVYAYWLNVTQAALLASAPAAGSITLKPDVLSNTVFGATQSGTWNVGITGSVAVTGTFWQATQPISAATLPLPAGAATAAKQDGILSALGSPYQAGGALPLPAGAATATGQATNTSAITATQAATGALAATAQTVTTTLPQLTASAGLAVSFGTTAAALFNANTSRHFLTVQVQGTTGGCYINGIGAATADANSLYIPAGGYFESSTHVGTGAVSIVCTAASTPVYSRQG